MYYLIVGATCAGKDKIANYITSQFKDFKIIVSTTSRPIRPGEKDGVEYHFVTRNHFETILNGGGFVEHRKYNTIVGGIQDTWYYGIEKKSITGENTNYVAVMDYKGATEFMEYVGKENTVLVYVKSPYAERYVRNVLRGDFSLPEWLRRNKDDAVWLDKARAESNILIENYGYDFPISPIDESFDVDIRDESVFYVETFEDTKKNVNAMIDHFSNRKRSTIK